MTETINNFHGQYRFLSNFYPSEIEFEGETYPTVEHAYQAAKTLEPMERALIRAAKTPGGAKGHGQQCTLRPDWNEVKIQVMRDCLTCKFARHPDLAEQLLATGDAELIEGNTWNDTVWGVCNGVGTNYLGKLLMEIREKLRNESK